jgi:hypothetical protein
MRTKSALRMRRFNNQRWQVDIQYGHAAVAARAILLERRDVESCAPAQQNINITSRSRPLLIMLKIVVANEFPYFGVRQNSKQINTA